MSDLSRKVHYPFTYGYEDVNEVMLSDRVVAFTKTKRFQSMLFAWASIVTMVPPSSAIPVESGEAANDLLNQAAQNIGGGEVLISPALSVPIGGGQIEGKVPLPQTTFTMGAMPKEHYHISVVQQAGQIPMGPVGGPTETSLFCIPPKPRLVGSRTANTVAFGAAIGIVCLNAIWGEPIAIVMCTSGLVGVTIKVGKKIISYFFSS